MISFLKTILIILLVYFGLKFLLKLVTPYLLRFITKKAAQRFEGAFGQSPFQQHTTTNAGETTINEVPKKQKNSGKIVGEYIDFEEVE